jgi:hypothetical protein
MTLAGIRQLQLLEEHFIHRRRGRTRYQKGKPQSAIDRKRGVRPGVGRKTPTLRTLRKVGVKVQLTL